MSRPLPAIITELQDLRVKCRSAREGALRWRGEQEADQELQYCAGDFLDMDERLGVVVQDLETIERGDKT